MNSLQGDSHLIQTTLKYSTLKYRILARVLSVALYLHRVTDDRLYEAGCPLDCSRIVDPETGSAGLLLDER